MSVHSVSKKGKRPQNEDAHNIILNIDNKDESFAPINFYGIYDGHGGKEISTYLSHTLPKYFNSTVSTLPPSGKYIRDVFKKVQTKLETGYMKTHAMNSGSTALILIEYIKDKKRYIDIANLGDSRCVICNSNMAITLTKDHKPHWPDEKNRIKSMGGNVYHDGYDWRIGDLSVSRAFGDLDNKPYITEVPELFRRKITKTDKFIILGCDGLWDEIEPQEAVNQILYNFYENDKLKLDKKNAAKFLANLALEKGSSDNVSVIVIFF